MWMTLKVFGWILAFFVAAGALLFVALSGSKWLASETGEQPALLLSLAFLVLVVAFVPYLNWAMRRSYVFVPERIDSEDEAQLREQILAINDSPAPVAVTWRGKKLIIHWRYLDAEVWTRLAGGRLTSAYELHVKLDGTRREAILTDVKKSLRFGIRPGDVRLGVGFTRGHFAGVEIGVAWNVRMSFSRERAHAFTFDPEEIKRPVINTILQAGWMARFGIW